MTTTPPLQAVDVTWRIVEKEILKAINIQADPDEFIGILGPNGSGKSSLLRCIFRYNQPDQGVIRLYGNDIGSLTVKETAQKVATVLQERDTEFDLTVLEVVIMGRTPHKSFFEQHNKNDVEIATTALSKVGMSGYLDRRLVTLSGGELQRTLLARALCQDAKILILDEPTNHLDIRFQIEMMSLIKELEITTVAALHDLNLASIFCDRVYIMADGRMVAAGPPREVLTEALIESVYGVKVKITTDAETKLINIAFLPPVLNQSRECQPAV